MRARLVLPLLLVAACHHAAPPATRGEPVDPRTAMGSAARGRIAGTLRTTAGPVGRDGRAVYSTGAGTVRMLRAGRVVARVDVGASGRFAIDVTRGTYDLRIDGVFGGACTYPATIEVQPGETATVTARCAAP